MSLRPFRKRVPQHELAAGRTVGVLFERYGRMVHAICRRNLRDRLDAEDATQQTFLSAYRSLLGGGEPTDPPAWLATIARNECSRVRKLRIVTVPIDDSPATEAVDVPSEVEQREEIEALAAALSELTPSQRDAVVLREFYGLSYAEVAAVLGVSGPAVESLLFKGRRQLQEKLGSLRVAGALVLPDSLRDALAQALPGFGGGAAAASAKVVAFPAATKVAVLVVAVAGGGVAVTEQAHREAPRPATSAVGRAADSAAQLVAPKRDLRPSIGLTPARTHSAGPAPGTGTGNRTLATVADAGHEVGTRDDQREEADEAAEERDEAEAAEQKDEGDDGRDAKADEDEAGAEGRGRRAEGRGRDRRAR